jgi:cytochrome P450/NADPH-cytochrome P450 reductase
MATIMQTFDLRLHDPSYSLEIKQTMTVKPHNLKINAIPRAGRQVGGGLARSASETAAKEGSGLATSKPDDGLKNLYVFYGSNTGTSEAFAQRIAGDAGSCGKDPRAPPLAF